MYQHIYIKLPCTKDTQVGDIGNGTPQHFLNIGVYTLLSFMVTLAIELLN